VVLDDVQYRGTSPIRKRPPTLEPERNLGLERNPNPEPDAAGGWGRVRGVGARELGVRDIPAP